MSDLIEIYSNPDFWLFNKEKVALALVISLTGFVWAITHEAGKTFWFWAKRKLRK